MLNSLHELTFSTTADSVEAGYIREDYYAVVKVEDQYREFIIDSIVESDDSDLIKEVKASLSSIELNDTLLENKVTGSDPRSLLTSILSTTRWSVGTVETGIYNRNFTEDVQFMTALEAIHTLADFYNCDIHFSYIIDGNKVVKRSVNLFVRLGSSDGKRFEIDKDITSIEREIDTTALKTAIYPVMKKEDDDGKTVLTTIANVAWSKAAGDPVDKPLGQKYIGDPVALQNWGRLDKNGNLRHRMKLYEFTEEVTVAQMLSMSWVNLAKYTSPKITYTVNVLDLYSLLGEEYLHEKVVIGDTVTIIDRYFAVPIEISDRVIEIERDLLDPSNTVVTVGTESKSYNSDRGGRDQVLNDRIEAVNKNAVSALESANGKNTIYYGSLDPAKPNTGDTWFRPHPDNPEEQQMLVWDGVQWIVELDTSKTTEIQDAIAVIDKDLEDNINTANDAVNKAEQAIESAGFANDIANETVAILADVKVTADNAKINADNAILDAQSALNKAIKSSVIHYAISENGATPPATGWETTNPDPTAAQYVWTRTTITLNDNTPVVSYSVGKIGAKGDQGLKGDAGDQGVPGVGAPTITSVVQQFYLSTSKTSQTGGSWLATVPVWSSGKYYWVRVATTYSDESTTTSTPVLDNALNDSLVTALEVKTANQELSTTVTQHATLIEGKANSTTVDAIDGRVTTAEGSISAIAGQVALKASTTDVNALKGRVTTAEGKITAQAGLIELKATQSEVDTLTGKVTATEASITASDGKITALTTKTNGHTTQIGQLQTSYTGLSSTVTALETNKVGTVAFSALEQNLNGFKTTVQNTYADKTTVNQLAGQWQTTTTLANGHTSQISSLGTQINLRATKTEVDEKILADKKIKDTRTTNQLPPWYYTNYPSQQAYEFKQCSTIGLPTSAGTYASVVTEVPWSSSSGGPVEQIATAGDGVYKRRGTTTWSAWAKVADSSNIISQINISPETILIASKKIQIKGDTYIENGVIKTAMIGDLQVSGAKIANASITSAKIVSLDASKISVGTLTGHTILGAVINGGTITQSDTGGYSLKMYNGKFDMFRDSDQILSITPGYNPNTGRPNGATIKQVPGEIFNISTGFSEAANNPKGYRAVFQVPAASHADDIQWQLFGQGNDINVSSVNISSVGAYNKLFVDPATNKMRISSATGVTISHKQSHGGQYDMFEGTGTTVNLHGGGSSVSNVRGAGISFGRDDGTNASGTRIWSMALYHRTYSAPGNMYITTEGTIGRAVSARKYKTNIQPEHLSKAKTVLQISPSSWLDKVEVANGKATKRYYGFIADDFHELGLTEVVQYGADGQVEGLAYDRISMYHHVILRDHEQQLATVTQQLNSVANNRLQETLLLESRLLSLQKTVEQLQQEIEQLRTA